MSFLLAKDILDTRSLQADEITQILRTADNMKKILISGHKKTAYLQGKTVVNLFYENSTRTRLSFELAAKYLGANTANISSGASSVKKGESLLDTTVTIDRMATDFIIMRHPQSGAPHSIASRVNASVINAGDGMNEHPTQALLDIYTMQDKLGSIEGLKVAILGDISHSRVARSNAWALQTLGAKVFLAGPRTLIPRDIAHSGVTVCSGMREACEDADVIMVLRIQLERQKSGLFPSVAEYSKLYGLTDDLLRLAKPHALVMHPGPVNRGIELPTSIHKSAQSVVDEQVTNGVAIRMALLYLLNLRRNQS